MNNFIERHHYEGKKSQAADWEGILEIHISDKGFVPTI
jgi:hypothetical protein